MGTINVIGRLMRFAVSGTMTKAKQIESVVIAPCTAEEDGLRGMSYTKKARELGRSSIITFSHIITLAKESDDAASLSSM